MLDSMESCLYDLLFPLACIFSLITGVAYVLLLWKTKEYKFSEIVLRGLFLSLLLMIIMSISVILYFYFIGELFQSHN